MVGSILSRVTCLWFDTFLTHLLPSPYISAEEEGTNLLLNLLITEFIALGESDLYARK